MKKFLQMAGLLFFAGVSSSASSQTSEAWIAKVGGKPIHFERYVRRYADFIASNGIKDNPLTRRAILENMVNEELLLHYDTNLQLEQNPNYLNDLDRAHKRTVTAYLKDREIYATITASEVEVRQAFARANEQLAARHLYARTEEEANALYQRLKSGEDFALLANEVFTDSTLRANGGYLGYFTWGDFDPAFEDAAYALRLGEISPPVPTAHGYSIIKLEDRISHPLLTESEFQRKKSHLEQVVKIRKKQPAEREYVKRILDTIQPPFDDTQFASLFNDLHALPATRTETVFSPVGTSNLTGTSLYYEFLQRLGALPQNQREGITSLEKLEAAVRGLLLQDRLIEIAHENGYDTLAVVTDAYEKMKDAVLLKYKLQVIPRQAVVSDEDAYRHYLDNLHLFSSENGVSIQEIIVAEKSLAESLREAIENGNDFGALAEQHSLRRWSAVSRGLIDLAPVSKFGQLKGVLWESPVNQLIGPIPIEGYYGLFRVVAKKPSELLAFEDARDRVKQHLLSERRREVVTDYVEKLGKKVGVEINEQWLMSFRLSDAVSP